MVRLNVYKYENELKASADHQGNRSKDDTQFEAGNQYSNQSHKGNIDLNITPTTLAKEFNAKISGD